MEKKIDKEAPNVVTENYLRSLIQDGYHAEVVCRAKPTKKAAVWYGSWIIRVVNQSRTYEKLLVSARNRATPDEEITARVFKTANGLISFIQDLGFDHVDIPLVIGRRTIHALSKNTSDNGEV